MIADPRVREKAEIIRDYVESMENLEGLKSSILKNFNCDVGEFTDTAEDGKKIKEIFAKMAPVGRIFEMDKELEDECTEWLTARNAPLTEVNQNRARALEKVNSIPEMDGLQHDSQSNYKLRAAYFKEFAKEQLGIGENEFQIAVNLPLKDETLRLNLEQLLRE